MPKERLLYMPLNVNGSLRLIYHVGKLVYFIIQCFTIKYLCILRLEFTENLSLYNRYPTSIANKYLISKYSIWKKLIFNNLLIFLKDFYFRLRIKNTIIYFYKILEYISLSHLHLLFLFLQPCFS